MSSRQAELIQDSFALAAEKRDQLSELFYLKLFALDPALRPMFPDNLLHQRRKLVSALALCVQLADDPDRLTAVVRELAGKHVGLGIEREDFAVVGEALLWALKQVLGDSLDRQAEEAWAATLTVLADIMMAEIERREGRVAQVA